MLGFGQLFGLFELFEDFGAFGGVGLDAEAALGRDVRFVPFVFVADDVGDVAFERALFASRPSRFEHEEETEADQEEGPAR